MPRSKETKTVDKLLLTAFSRCHCIYVGITQPSLCSEYLNLSNNLKPSWQKKISELHGLLKAEPTQISHNLNYLFYFFQAASNYHHGFFRQNQAEVEGWEFCKILPRCKRICCKCNLLAQKSRKCYALHQEIVDFNLVLPCSWRHLTFLAFLSAGNKSAQDALDKGKGAASTAIDTGASKVGVSAVSQNSWKFSTVNPPRLQKTRG